MKQLIILVSFTLSGLLPTQFNKAATPVLSGLQNDSLRIAQMLNTPVRKIIYNSDSSLWVIAGTDSSGLFRINTKGSTENIKTRYALPHDAHFTDVVTLSTSRTLVGTSNHYTYLLRNDKTLWLNSFYGLTDSAIVKFDYDKKQELLLVTTASSRFLMRHMNKIRSIRFVELKDTLSTFNEMVHYFNQNIRKPFQKKVLDIVGDVDFSFRKNKYLNSSELDFIKAILKPGDIILRRNVLYLTNIGIPGFWTHSGIYTGDTVVMDAFFDGIPMLAGQRASAYIADNYPDIARALRGKPHAVIEAIAEGVVIEPVEHIGNADYLVILRTGLPREDLFKSILTAFEYYNTPYDFLFDFSNDNELVCSELLYYAFRPAHDKKGLLFRFGTVDGKPFLSPNDIAKQCCTENKNQNKTFTMLYYFDANLFLRKKKADEKDFCKTWKKKQ